MTVRINCRSHSGTSSHHSGQPRHGRFSFSDRALLFSFIDFMLRYYCQRLDIRCPTSSETLESYPHAIHIMELPTCPRAHSFAERLAYSAGHISVRLNNASLLI